MEFDVEAIKEEYPTIRPAIIEAVGRYHNSYIPTGNFLRAVLENDLQEAVARADLENRLALAEIVIMLYNNLPSGCWGRPEEVEAWLMNKRIKSREAGNGNS